jgi:hypothetical protein
MRLMDRIRRQNVRATGVAQLRSSILGAEKAEYDAEHDAADAAEDPSRSAGDLQRNERAAARARRRILELRERLDAVRRPRS